jgi:Uma2 family endonuclease
MQDYLDCGVRLGWLIDFDHDLAYVYRPGVQVEVLEGPPELRGDPVLPGFVLDLRGIKVL